MGARHRRAAVLAAAAAVCAGAGPAGALVPVTSPRAATAIGAQSTTLVDEAVYLANERILPDDLSPGLYYPEGSLRPVIRVYRDADRAAVARCLRGADAETIPSRFTRDELATAEAAMGRVPIAEGEVLAGSYDARSDLLELGGSVEAVVVAAHVPRGTYSYTQGPRGEGGRLSGTVSAPEAVSVDALTPPS